MPSFLLLKKYTGKGVQMEDCVKCQKEHTFRIETIEEEMKEGKKSLIDMKIKQEKIDESTKSAHKRLDEIGEQTLAIYKLTVAVENIAEQLVEFTQENKEHRKEVNTRLDKLEKAPGEEANSMQKEIKKTIIIGIVGALLGAVLMKLGVKL